MRLPRSWKKLLSAVRLSRKGIFGARTRSLRLEPLEVRQLLTVVTVSASDPLADEEPDALATTDWGSITVTRSGEDVFTPIEPGKTPKVVGVGLGWFFGYRPYIALPFKLRRTWRSINARTISAQTSTHNKPAIRSGFSRNIGITANGPLQ